MNARSFVFAAAAALIVSGPAAAIESGPLGRAAPEGARPLPFRFCYDVYVPEGRLYRNTCTGDLRELRRLAPPAERDSAGRGAAPLPPAT